jgi:hypothetical protein
MRNEQLIGFSALLIGSSETPPRRNPVALNLCILRADRWGIYCTCNFLGSGIQTVIWSVSLVVCACAVFFFPVLGWLSAF